MSLILAIDTSAGTHVAVVRDGVALAGAHRADPRGHAEFAVPLIEQALAQAGVGVADLDAIAVGTGPAPFTGLRVGLVTAAALGRARQIPVHGVASLAGWAESARALGAERVRVITDARRREVYTAVYELGPQVGDVREREEPQVIAPAELAEKVGREREAGIAVVGPGLFPDLLGPAAGSFDVAALAVIAARLVAAGEPTPTEPRYLRRPDVHGVPGGAA